jgi:hypothetical protein
MTRKAFGILIGLTAAGMALPLSADGGSKKIFEVTTTQQVPFQPGGTIHFNRSYGYLSIEGWDRPEVEITVIKSLDNLYDAKGQAEATKRVNTVQVTAERKTDTDLDITTTVPHYSRWTHPLGSTGGVMVEYQVHVPRDSKLAIQHGTGDVLVTRVANDIEADVHSGDIVVLLPETVQYAIDAKSKLGTVSSDVDGDFHRGHLVGIRYAHTAAAPSHKLNLRVGVGGITIKSSVAPAPPSGPASAH